MGNKHASTYGYSPQADRSISWQPDPLFAYNVRQSNYQNFNVSTPSTPPVGPPPTPLTSDPTVHGFPFPLGHPFAHHGRVGSASHIGLSRKGSASAENGSIIRDGNFFNGIDKAPAAVNQGIFSPGQPPILQASSSSPVSRSKKTEGKMKSGNSDSGYLTSGYFTDSDKSARNKMRGSRLSLQEAVFAMPPNFAAPAMFASPRPPPPPPFGMPPMYPPMTFLVPVTEEKKGKKWRKSSKKDMVRHGSINFSDHASMTGFYPHLNFPPPNTHLPPMMPAVHPLHKAKSIDNVQLVASGIGGPAHSGTQLVPYVMPAASGHGAGFRGSRQYVSNVDVSQMPSGGGSFRDFYEDHMFKPEQHKKARKSVVELEKSHRNSKAFDSEKENDRSLKRFKNSFKTAEEQALYDTLKTSKSTNEPITAHDNDVIVSSTVKILPDAQEIMNRNAALLGMQPLTESEINLSMSDAPSEKKTNKRSGNANEIDEAIIEPVMHSQLPRNKVKKPRDFEPFEAWKSINVGSEVSVRQPQRDLPTQEDVAGEAKIIPRLLPIPAPKHDGTEPIYVEYDERLPDFKKRLIETGSFDLSKSNPTQSESDRYRSGHNKRSVEQSTTLNDDNDIALPASKDAPKVEKNWKSYLIGDSHSYYPAHSENKMRKSLSKENVVNGSVGADGTSIENAGCANADFESKKQKSEGNKGSLRNIKSSISNMFKRSREDLAKENNSNYGSKFDDRFNNATIRSNASLTPSTAQIKAGDSSDIDFSWVTDLESRFRFERQQFDQELKRIRQRDQAYLDSTPQGPQQQPQFSSTASYNPQEPQFASYVNERSLSRLSNQELPALNRSSPSYMPAQPTHPVTGAPLSQALGNAPRHWRVNSTPETWHAPSGESMHESATERAQTPMNSRYPDQQASRPNNLRLFGHSSTLQSSNDKYSSPDSYSRGYGEQLSPSGNVLSKAALFEQHAKQVNQQMVLRDQQLSKQRQQQSNPYIPKPDYDDSPASGLNGHGHAPAFSDIKFHDSQLASREGRSPPSNERRYFSPNSNRGDSRYAAFQQQNRSTSHSRLNGYHNDPFIGPHSSNFDYRNAGLSSRHPLYGSQSGLI